MCRSFTIAEKFGTTGQRIGGARAHRRQYRSRPTGENLSKPSKRCEGVREERRTSVWPSRQKSSNCSKFSKEAKIIEESLRMLNVYNKLQVNRLTDFLAVHSRFLQALRRFFPSFFLFTKWSAMSPNLAQTGKIICCHAEQLFQRNYLDN